MKRALLVAVLFLAACVSDRSATTAPPPAPAAASKAEDIREAGARDPAFFRAPGPRAQETIFSALDLPTPTTVRTASGAPGPDYWQQRVDYVIETTLHEERRSLSGRAVITYTNNSPEPLPFLWLHLEQNLFRPDSLGALSVEPGTRFGPQGFEGGMTIHSVRTVPDSEEAGDPVDLPLAVYDTLGRVDLPAPVPPKGGRFRFEVTWSFNIPPYGVDRMGIDPVKAGEIFQLAQWFPAVAVFDDVHGWNTLPYLGQGEFYTNFGDYDVRITVPRSHIVGATGVLQNPEQVLTETQRERLERARRSERPIFIIEPDEVGRPDSRPEGDSPLTWHFKAENVRTFAFASSKAFIWDAAFLADSGPIGDDGHPVGTLCQSLYPREAMPNWSNHSTDDLRWSIDYYNRQWFRYPYPTATNVNGVVGGMEYPMIIFCGARTDRRGLFGVTTHEIGHNWFPMIVSTDERRHAWMDEGFNTFINYYAYADRFPGTENTRRGNARAHIPQMILHQQQPMDTPADRIWRGRLGSLQYAKTAVALVLLREVVLGRERFDPALRRYIELWAFKSPRPADFFRCIENAAGVDLAWFWRGWILETGVLDQEVTEVSHRDGKAYVTFTNRRELVMPVDYRVTYDDGSTEDRRLPVEAWTTTNQWTAMWETPKRITKVELDPEGKLPDVNLENNVWEDRGE